MPLTATKSQTASLLGVSDDTVDNLLHQGRLRRTLGNRFVHITLESVAEYTHLPLEIVVNEFQLAPRVPSRPSAEPETSTHVRQALVRGQPSFPCE
jgi:hypothetical protein